VAGWIPSQVPDSHLILLEPFAAWRSSLSDRIGIAVVGTGDWGANLVRNYASLPGARLVAVCDADPQRLARTAAQYPGVRAQANVADVARDPEVQGVVVSASAVSHHPLAKALLEAGRTSSSRSL